MQKGGVYEKWSFFEVGGESGKNGSSASVVRVPVSALPAMPSGLRNGSSG